MNNVDEVQLGKTLQRAMQLEKLNKAKIELADYIKEHIYDYDTHKDGHEYQIWDKCIHSNHFTKLIDDIKELEGK